jgi:hypothetical protein
MIKLETAMELFAWYGFMSNKPITIARFLSLDLSTSKKLTAAQKTIKHFLAVDPTGSDDATP